MEPYRAVEPAAATLALWDAVQDFASAHKEQCVSYAALEDAAAATPSVVQQRGATSPHAPLLLCTNGTHLELYRSPAVDDTGAPLRTVTAVYLEHMDGMVAAKLCSLTTPGALSAFLAELRCLKRRNGRWGLSFDWRRRLGAIITDLYDGGDLAGLIDRAVLQASRRGERIRPHLLLRPVADVAQQVFEFNCFESHAWMDGTSSNVALRQQGSAAMMDAGSALPHGPARREDIVGGCSNHDAYTLVMRHVSPQSDVGCLGMMTMDALLGRPANSASVTAGAVGYKHTTVVFRMIQDFANDHRWQESADLEMPVSNLLGFEPLLGQVGLLLVALLICPDNTVKLTLGEAACGLRGLARAQELFDTRQDGLGGVPYLAHSYLLLAQLCAFIGQQRPGLPESPSVSRGGAAVLGEAGLAVVRNLYSQCISNCARAVHMFAPYWTRQGTLQAMPAWMRALLGSRVFIVLDVYRSAVSMQKELAGSGGSALTLALLPHLAPEVTRAAGLQFVLTLQGVGSSVGSSGSVAGSSKGSSRTAGTKQPAGRAGRGAAGRGAAGAQDAENSCVQPWLDAAAELIAAKGVARGPVSLTCEWSLLWALLREQGIGACPQLSAAWQVLALRSLASFDRVQRHLHLYLCVQDPTAAGTQFVPLPTRFQPRDYTDSKLAQL